MDQNGNNLVSEEIREQHRILDKNYYEAKKKDEIFSKDEFDLRYIMGVYLQSHSQEDDTFQNYLKRLDELTLKLKRVWIELYDLKQRKLELEWNNSFLAPAVSTVYKKSCEYCKETFYSYVRRQKYCCSRHMWYFFRDRRKERHHKTLEGRKCNICNKVFKAKRKDMIYCSKACKQIAYRNKNKTE